MSKCTSCGRDLADNTRFCPGCGKSVEAAQHVGNAQAAPGVAEGIRCQACGTALSSSSPFCTSCGARVGAQGNDTGTTRSSTNESYRCRYLALRHAHRSWCRKGNYCSALFRTPDSESLRLRPVRLVHCRRAAPPQQIYHSRGRTVCYLLGLCHKTCTCSYSSLCLATARITNYDSTFYDGQHTTARPDTPWAKVTRHFSHLWAFLVVSTRPIY